MHLPNTKKKSTISAFPNIHKSTITNNNNPFHPLKSPTFCVTKTETRNYCQGRDRFASGDTGVSAIYRCIQEALKSC